MDSLSLLAIPAFALAVAGYLIRDTRRNERRHPAE